MKKLKYPRTVFYDIDNKVWTSYYKNDKGKTIIEKTGRKLDDVINREYKSGHVSRLSAEALKNNDYSYFIMNKKDRRSDYIPELVKFHDNIERILRKKKVDEVDREILFRALDSNTMNNLHEKIIKKLEIKKTVHDADTEFIVKNVAIFKYSSTAFYIPKKQHKRMKEILSKYNKKIQLEITIDNETFFTPYFKPTKNKSYEKLITEIIKQYPSKITWGVRNIKVRVF